jgi:hypothetical protein
MMIEFVNVGPGGTFEKSGKYATSATQVDEFFQELESSDAKSLVLHFHGGLVDEAYGVGVAKKMVEVYKEAGAVPLTFVWETGLLETFRDNLLKIHETDLYKKLLKWLLRRLAERFGGFEARGVGVSIPMKKIEEELAKDKPFDSYDDPTTGKVAAARGGAFLETDLDTLQAEFQAQFQGDVDGDEDVVAKVNALIGSTADAQARGLIEGLKVAKMLAAVAYRVARRHVRGRDHGFYPTVVEETLRELYLADLGAWVWGRMKDKARNMWLSNDRLTGDERRVGRYVLEKIALLQKKKPSFRFDLVGHSAGSIAICELLRIAAADNIAVQANTIAFLAPAGRSEIGVAELVGHTNRFKQFRCYTMADEFEREDSLVKGIYTRSLLYFISGVLESDEVDAPLMGMMRHATKTGAFTSGPAAEWASYIRGNQRLVLSDSTILDPDAVVGYQTSACSHGDFDDDKLTRKSLTELLRI